VIQRDFYTEKIIRAMWNGDVKVITGIRRCGKSVLLFDLYSICFPNGNRTEDNI
jgi:predicted AAA+ superfamily ATPase